MITIETLTYDEASDRHKMVEDGTVIFEKAGFDRTATADVWDAIVGRAGDERQLAEYAEAIRLSMPIDVVPIVGSGNGLAAAFAFEAAAAFYPGTQAQGFELREAAHKAWAAFEERKKAAETLREGFGFGIGWDWSPAWEILRQVEEIGDEAAIEEVAKLAGRLFKALDRAAPKAQTDDPHEVRDVEQGGEVERLLASEVAQLFTPGLEDQAAIKILQGNAQQYRMKGRNAASRGPLVICLDESGSMMASLGSYSRNTWAKAAAVALTRVAHAGNRQVRVVHFSTGTKVSRLAPGDDKAVLDMTRGFLDGGTAIAKALNVAVREVGNLEAEGYVGADIVLVTDGQDSDEHAQSRILDLMQIKGIRLWTVAVEMELHGGAPIAWRAEKAIRIGANPAADAISALIAAAENVVTPEQEAARKAAAN